MIEASFDFVSAMDIARVYRAAVFIDVPVVIIVIGAPWLPEKLRECIKQNTEDIIINKDDAQTINYYTEMMPDFCFIFCQTESEAEKIEKGLLDPLIKSVSPELQSNVIVVTDIYEDKTPPAN